MRDLNKYDFEDVMDDLEQATAVLGILEEFMDRELEAMEKTFDVLAYRFVAERIKCDFFPAFGLAMSRLREAMDLLKRKEREDPKDEG